MAVDRLVSFGRGVDLVFMDGVNKYNSNENIRLYKRTETLVNSLTLSNIREMALFINARWGGLNPLQIEAGKNFHLG